jgi:hypothetical protein
MAGFTNRGKHIIADVFFKNVSAPATFYAALVTSAVAPSATTNILSDLTEIAAGNGYTAGGQALTRDATGFPTSTEDDVNNREDLFARSIVFTASGGNLPASGNGARWLVILDDNATVGSRQVIAYFDLSADRTVSTGQSLTITTPNLRFDEV